jgi:hypothetical protein
VPQAWLTFRTRDVSGISLGMYSVFTTGLALWLVYGLLLAAWPIVAANAVTLALALAILVDEAALSLTRSRRLGDELAPAPPYLPRHGVLARSRFSMLVQKRTLVLFNQETT